MIPLIKSIIITLLIGSLFGDRPQIVVLGIAQDGGAPHAGCEKRCCIEQWESGKKEKVSSIGIVNPLTKRSWLFDATPDFPSQYRILTENHNTELVGIFLTHAHMGHYTGLLFLGIEVVGKKNVPVYVISRMKRFLETNGPWSQLVTLKNINLKLIENNKYIKIGEQLFIEPFLVPHRDEYFETVGYLIIGNEKSLAFIPDIDKWEKWHGSIFQLVLNTDILLLDGTFFSQSEILHRNMAEIPPPLVTESMETLSELNWENRNKVHFTHYNHSNRAIKDKSPAYHTIKAKRFNLARGGDRFNL